MNLMLRFRLLMFLKFRELKDNPKSAESSQQRASIELVAIVSAGAEGAHKTNLKILTEPDRAWQSILSLLSSRASCLKEDTFLTVFPNPSLPRLACFKVTQTQKESMADDGASAVVADGYWCATLGALIHSYRWGNPHNISLIYP